jgi:NAD(P)-dependent dehydrogenase (short-subunit alcohol dehydrogenase family)
VLVNSAAISHAGKHGRSLGEIGKSGRLNIASLDEVRAVFDTNVFGVIAVTQAMLPLLREAPAGRIVSVSSASGSLTLHSDPKNPHRSMFGTYSSSKTALNAITLAFALALKSTGIKVNAACPGFTATDLNNFEDTRTVQQAAREPGKRGAQHVAAIDAAVRAGVKHIVFTSAAGTRKEEEPALGASYWRGEQHLIATAPAWTIVRMNYYAEALVQQAQASLDQGILTGLAENRVAFVARGDVAAAAAGILIGDGHAGAIYNATGPERLSVRNAWPSSPKSLADRLRSVPSRKSNCAPD